METYEHLPLNSYKGEVQRQKRKGGGGYKLLDGRIKSDYSKNTIKNSEKIISSFSTIENRYSGILNPSLIFEIEINQGAFKLIEQSLVAMGIHVLATAENKKGFWVVFSDDVKLESFNKKLTEYGEPLGDFVPEDAFVGDSISLKNSCDIRKFFQQHGILDVNFLMHLVC
jgi:hypothetical protein